MSNASERFNQSFPAVMSTLGASQITTAVVQIIQFCSCLLWFPRIFAYFSSKIFSEYGKCVATAPLFSETSDKEVAYV